MTQPGYDAMADLYAESFPSPYQFPIERHVVAAFAELAAEREGRVVDVGCGLGHVTADLARQGLNAVGCDPSAAMLARARQAHPELTFLDDDARLRAIGPEPIAALLARFSLIHLEPAQVIDVLDRWSARLAAGTPVLVAFQASDAPGAPLEFDHAVAPAWRWHPDEFSRVLRAAGFDEVWRIVYRDESYRFPMAALLACRR